MKSILTMFILIGGALLMAFTAPVTDGLKVGDKAPDFKLQNAIDNSWVSLSEMKDVKGYIVIFTCNTCPYAVMYEDRIIDLHNAYASKGYPVVAVMPNDTDLKPGDNLEAMKARAEEKGFPFPYLIDAKQEVFPAYGATRTPHVFLLDKEMTVRYIGAIDNNPQDAAAADEHYVADAIAALEDGKSPDPDFTKAIGCTIKVKS